MTSKILIVVFAFLALTSAHTMHRSKRSQAQKEINSEAHFQSLKDSAFGKNLFNMMSLKFKTSGQVDDILSLLDELASNIASQQQDDDDTYALVKAADEDVIAKQDHIATEAQGNIDEWTQIVKNDNDAHTQKTTDKNSHESEIETIEAFLEQLTEQRQKENELYIAKNADQVAISQGLDEVIALFTAEYENDDNIDRDAGEEVLDLLSEIKAAVEAAITDDTQRENDAQVAYNNFKTEKEATLEELRTELAEINAEIERLETEIESRTADIATEKVKRDNALQLSADTKAHLDAATEKHNADTQVRSSQTVLIGQVKARLRDVEDVSSFLQI